VTYDNGTENAERRLLNQEIGAPSFFCEPYHCWEKGSVEDKNAMVRRQNTTPLFAKIGLSVVMVHLFA